MERRIDKSVIEREVNTKGHDTMKCSKVEGDGTKNKKMNAQHV